MEAAPDVDTINEAELLSHLDTSIALQLFCDGGFAAGRGAAAFVVTCVIDTGSGFQSLLLGARGCLLANSKSAFHAEVTAIDMATEFLTNLAKMAKRY